MKRTGGEIIIDCLINEQIEYVVGIPGHGCLSIFDALRDRVEKKQIKYIQVMQEMDAVYLADGYYRSTGKPLAVITSIGPGSLNTVIGLGTAYVDSTPVIVIAGDTHTYMRGSGVLQELERKHDSDVLSCFRPATKRCWRVESISQLPKIMQRAFNVMLTGRRGPVVVTVPMDLQAQQSDADLPDVEYRRTCALQTGDADRIAAAVKMMSTATRPVIIAGGGLLHAQAFGQLVMLAEFWGAAVVTTMAGKGAFPENHPLYGWHGGSKGTDLGNHLCRTADVVLALGCRFADETTSSYRKGITYNFPETKLIHVDIDPTEIGKNYPCDVGIIGDVSAVIPQLTSALEQSCPTGFSREVYNSDIEKQRRAWFGKLDAIAGQSCGLLTISSFLRCLKQAFPADGYIVTSSGNTQAQVFQEYAFDLPGRHITTGGFSTMGFAFPAAIGIKLAHPDAAVAALVGDGDFLMAMQELCVLKQHGLNVTVVVLNNSGWLAIRDLQADVYGMDYTFGSQFRTPDGKLYSPDFSQVAQAFGIHALRVEKPDELDIKLQEALAHPGPALLEVIVTSEYPASGGVATGWWDVPVPPYMTSKYADYISGRSEEIIS
jgi:acetolactate synthase-1/2/3 large subunit